MPIPTAPERFQEDHFRSCTTTPASAQNTTILAGSTVAGIVQLFTTPIDESTEAALVVVVDCGFIDAVVEELLVVEDVLVVVATLADAFDDPHAAAASAGTRAAAISKLRRFGT
jgi:hypothetical protein